MARPGSRFFMPPLSRRETWFPPSEGKVTSGLRRSEPVLASRFRSAGFFPARGKGRYFQGHSGSRTRPRPETARRNPTPADFFVGMARTCQLARAGRLLRQFKRRFGVLFQGGALVRLPDCSFENIAFPSGKNPADRNRDRQTGSGRLVQMVNLPSGVETQVVPDETERAA